MQVHGCQIIDGHAENVAATVIDGLALKADAAGRQ
jgi:hypothetical protein